MAASVFPLWLMAITGQLSYPLNSENARPFGILRAYLSCVEVAARACDGAAVETEAASRRGSLWMNVQVSRCRYQKYSISRKACL
jgi:hypothetical protein